VARRLRSGGNCKVVQLVQRDEKYQRRESSVTKHVFVDFWKGKQYMEFPEGCLSLLVQDVCIYSGLRMCIGSI
jgi:hypothetical protein